MTEIILILIIVFGSIMATTLGCVWMGTSYAAKKRGFTKGASEREIKQLQDQVIQIQQEVRFLQKEVNTLIQIAKGIVE